MQLDLDKVRTNVAQADTEDLLDRATVYRVGMEPEALAIIEAELRERGITARDIDEHEIRRNERVLIDVAGVARKCSCCDRPAVAEGWGWHRLWGWAPVFPRWLRWCD